MKAPYLLTATSLLSLLSSSAVQAEQIALSFELDEVDSNPAVEPPPSDTAPPVQVTVQSPKALPIPAGAGNPPMRSHSPNQLPGGVYRRAVATSLNAGNAPAALLPPAPPLLDPPTLVAQQAPPKQASEPVSEQTPEEPVTVALSFDIVTPKAVQIAAAEPKQPPQLSANPLEGLFEGGSDSLVARAVGSAEGTRTPNGAINPAYYGHTDPGNGVWNMGTFSYQHGAKTAAEADQKQLQRLQSQTQVLKKRALKHDLNLNLEETLNGIDLANQSPLASIGRVGYIERLVEARNMGYTGFESIVVARTRSYINPDTQRWNAPGLGNTLESITRDQRRRANAVARALEAYQQENPQIDWEQWAMFPASDTAVATQPPAPEKTSTPAKEDFVFALWTDGSGEKTQLADASSDADSPRNQPKINRDFREVSPSAKPSKTGQVPRIISVLRSGLRPAGNPMAVTAVSMDSSEALSPESLEGVSPQSAEAVSLDSLAAISLESPEPVATESTKKLPEDPPTWVATLERNQSHERPTQNSQSSRQEPYVTMAEDSLPVVSQEQPTAKVDSAADQTEAEGNPPEANTLPQGAAPETKVLPPLQKDTEPLVLPGFRDQEQVEPIAQGRHTKEVPSPLPEGFLGQLKTQVETVKEDPAEGFTSVRDQITEKLFEIDFSTLPE